MYGIPNCDAVKKAKDWFKLNNIDVQFHNFREEPISAAIIKNWITVVGPGILLNKNSSTWRNLPQEIKNKSLSKNAAVKIMEEYPTLIKRPVVATNGTIVAGFKEDIYQSIFLNP
ncbi:MAG: hypothetical protein JWQ27_1484 [Ferruginibacter sp.]|nr:hypothetical protein [Ferruginibacter sp.]